jgi:hypothetical protein
MKRSPAATRSYLRQLAEPVPQPAALLKPRNPIERGVSNRSSVAAIPPILDSISDRWAETATQRHRLPRSTPDKGPARTPDFRVHPVEISTEHQLDIKSAAASHIAPSVATTASHDNRTDFTMLAVDEARTRHHNTTRENPILRESIALQNNATPGSKDHKESITQIPTAALITAKASTSTESNHIARDQSSRGSRVHIGTVEVRTTPPAREPKPAPAIDRNFRTGRSDGTVERLSRGLAWSHGLVQG